MEAEESSASHRGATDRPRRALIGVTATVVLLGLGLVLSGRHPDPFGSRAGSSPSSSPNAPATPGSPSSTAPSSTAPSSPSDESKSEDPEFEDANGVGAADLLDRDQIARLGTGVRWRVTGTHDNTAGDGINTVCQQERFALRTGLGTLVRTFQARGKVPRRAVQTVEVASSPRQARRGFAVTRGWFAGCQEARLQLVRSYRVRRVGNEALILLLRHQGRPVTTTTVALARIGRVTTSTVATTRRVPGPPVGAVAQSLADSVAMLCDHSGARTCPTTPRAVRVPPPPAGDAPGFLAVADLPAVGDLRAPWVGTGVSRARPNPALTLCDQADFVAAGADPARARTYLVPQASLPVRFGLSETYGRFAGSGRARAFVDDVASRVSACASREQETTVSGAAAGRLGRDTGWRSWQLATRVSERDTVRFRLAFVRVGRDVAQLSFAPTAGHDMSGAEFRALVVRAGERLRELG